MALYYCYECDMRLNEDEIPAHEHPRKNDELCCSECYMMLQERAEDEINGEDYRSPRHPTGDK